MRLYCFCAIFIPEEEQEVGKYGKRLKRIISGSRIS